MIEKEKFFVTHKELVEKFGAATTDTTKIVGKWIYQNQLYEEALAKVLQS
jgi:hypothetical protein